MSFVWKKISCLIKPSSNLPWWVSRRAGGACAIKRSDSNLFDFYITGIDREGRSRIGHALWDPDSPHKLLEIDNNPCIELGHPGTFSENGTSYPSVIKIENKYYMFFTGWQLGKTVPFYNNLGLAFCTSSGGPFKYVSKAPIFPLSETEPYGIGSCNVSFDNKNKIYRLFYTSFQKFIEKEEKVHHKYCIKYTQSKFVNKWSSSDKFILKNTSENDSKICKPTFVDNKNMLFCQRGIESNYKIFSATMRKNQWKKSNKPIKLVGEKSQWDEESQCYPFIFKYNNTNYLLYSGNNYGQGGLGIAYQVDDK